jgi:hypothetical protein
MRTKLEWQKCTMKENRLACMKTKKSYLMLYFLLLGLCFVAEGLQGRSGFIMSEQVSSDLYQKGRSSKDTKVDTVPKL